MTSPAAPPQQAPAQQQKPSDEALIAAILAALLLLHSAKAITARLRVTFSAAGISGSALKAAVALVLKTPQQPMQGTGPAARAVDRTNSVRRAAYVLAAARRIEQAMTDARAQGEPIADAIKAALAREQNYSSQHVAASQGRSAAAAAVDSMAAVHGNILGWKAQEDARCTPGCRQASGKNFRADRPPTVEGHPAYPGMVHGATCRCVPVKPWPGAPLMALPSCAGHASARRRTRAVRGPRSEPPARRPTPSEADRARTGHGWPLR